MRNIKNLLSTVSFFHNMNIDVINEYTNDPNPKCFLVSSKDTGKKYKVRISIDEGESNVKKELRVFQYLQENRVRYLPEIYHYNLSGNFHVLIYEYFEGKSLEKIDNLAKSDFDKIQTKLIKTIKEFRSLKYHQCKSYLKVFDSWYDYFVYKMNEHLESKESKLLFSPKEIFAIKQKCKVFEDEMRSKQNYFIHYDIKPKNIIYNQADQEAYLIDYELGRFGDNLMEFVRLKSFSQNEDYTSYLVNPILDYFNVNIAYGKNLFTLYLLYCYIVYHRYYYSIYLNMKSQYHFKEAENFKLKTQNILINYLR
ncbi:phosphotransferase [Tenacibaculum sp.]|uniref:phosphotransferase n=1 Tax=Tenacibaculum sp. TaxID=1906242 RepID=UPI003D09EB2B